LRHKGRKVIFLGPATQRRQTGVLYALLFLISPGTTNKKKTNHLHMKFCHKNEDKKAKVDICKEF